jgi:hypothetical protein
VGSITAVALVMFCWPLISAAWRRLRRSRTMKAGGAGDGIAAAELRR